MLWSMRTLLILTSILFLGAPSQSFGAPDLSVQTTYDDDRDVFITTGTVHLESSVDALQTVAGHLSQYGRWALRGINIKASGKPFIIKLRSVDFLPGPPYGKGHFKVGFDVDLVWPFRRKGQTIKFGVVEARKAPPAGIDRLEIDLYGSSRFIKGFRIVLVALPNGEGSAVAFKAEVKLTGFIDTFFPLGVYRRNIEYRVVKVIENLRYFLMKDREK